MDDVKDILARLEDFKNIVKGMLVYEHCLDSSKLQDACLEMDFGDYSVRVRTQVEACEATLDRIKDFSRMNAFDVFSKYSDESGRINGYLMHLEKAMG